LTLSAKCKRRNNKLLPMLDKMRNGGICRNELAKAFNLNKAAISRSVNQLIEWGLVTEKRSSASNALGRRPVPLQLKKNLFYSVGINLQHQCSEIALLNARGEVAGKLSIKNMSGNWMEKCEMIIQQVKNLINDNGIPIEKLVGVGIGLPGIVDPEIGAVFSSSQFKNEPEFNLLKYFTEKLGKESFLINTSHLSAYSEHYWGGAQNMDSFLTLLPGMGLGMFLNGRLYRGHQFHSGEAGSMQLQPDGEIGLDGRKGTLGSLVKFYDITDRMENIIAKGGNTEVNKYLRNGSGKVTLEMVVKAIEDGDQFCAQMMSEIFEVIGRAILNFAYLFNPEAIFLPEWTARCPEASIDIVRRMMGHYGVSNWRLKTEICSAQCGESMMARGAGLLPVENMFGNTL